jgi:uncharacterized protein
MNKIELVKDYLFLNDFNTIINKEFLEIFNKSLVIGFYGGEPLLQYTLIDRIVEYAKMLFANWNLNFNVTTNGTILDEKIVDFLKRENFSVLVSLDGPRKNHDSKRLYPNEKGTFTDIWNNLRMVSDLEPEFFKKNISFSAVYSPDLPFYDVYKFFSEEEMVLNCRSRCSMVNPQNTTYFDEFEVDMNSYRNDLDRMLLNIYKKMRNNQELVPFESYMWKRFVGNKMLNHKEYNVLEGTCLFDDRLFIDTEGKFHICEKISNKYSIGDGV